MGKNENNTVGILGNGQLARMLAESASRMGLLPIVYAEDDFGPASQIAYDSMVGKISDTRALAAFVSHSRIIAFENEFVDCAALRHAHGAEKFSPSIECIELLQDKLAQKRLFERAGLPSSPFVEVRSLSDVDEAFDTLSGDVVLKWSRFGYDGKGVKVVAKSHLGDSEEFLKAANSRGIPVYAERKVDFVRELAIVGCAGRDGAVVTYPLVISKQENGICKEVMGPATRLGVSQDLEDRAREFARVFAHTTRIVGTFALEMFETRSGELLINETAPRVHNSGHYTQNAFPVSQFENHWRAILEMPLFDPMASPLSYFAMRNLLGAPGISIPADQAPLPVAGPRSQLHWYGKNEIRPGRKLGHLNGIAESEETLWTLLKELKVCEEEWVRNLQRKPSP